MNENGSKNGQQAPALDLRRLFAELKERETASMARLDQAKRILKRAIILFAVAGALFFYNVWRFWGR
jgi:hypothetical protein